MGMKNLESGNYPRNGNVLRRLSGIDGNGVRNGTGAPNGKAAQNEEDLDPGTESGIDRGIENGDHGHAIANDLDRGIGIVGNTGDKLIASLKTANKIELSKISSSPALGSDSGATSLKKVLIICPLTQV